MHKLPAWRTPGRGSRPLKDSFKIPWGENMHSAALQTVPAGISFKYDMAKGKNKACVFFPNVALIWHVWFSAPLVDSNSIHSGSAMLMLLTVVFVGLAAFFIYKFKRCVRLDKQAHSMESYFKLHLNVFESCSANSLSLGKSLGSTFKLWTVMRRNRRGSVQSVRMTTCQRSSSVSFPPRKSSWKRSWRPGGEVSELHMSTINSD